MLSVMASSRQRSLVSCMYYEPGKIYIVFRKAVIASEQNPNLYAFSNGVFR